MVGINVEITLEVIIGVKLSKRAVVKEQKLRRVWLE